LNRWDHISGLLTGKVIIESIKTTRNEIAKYCFMESSTCNMYMILHLLTNKSI
jgi:hypothetical protein